jgi:hypothetical protein
MPGVVPSTVCFYQIEYKGGKVFRRFSEFKVLRARLMEEDKYKGMIFPLLPEEEGLWLFRDTSDSIYRLKMTRLESFLNRLVAMKPLEDDLTLLDFFDERVSFRVESYDFLMEMYDKLNSLNLSRLKSLGKAFLYYSYSNLLGKEELPSDIQQYRERLQELALLQSRFETIHDKAQAMVVCYQALGLPPPISLGSAGTRVQEFRWMVQEALSTLAVYDEMHNNCTWVKTMAEISTSPADKTKYES